MLRRAISTRFFAMAVMVAAVGLMVLAIVMSGGISVHPIR